MVCSVCGELGHNVKSCPTMKESSHDKRGLRDSPRTPAQEHEAKIAKLREMSKKLSPDAGVPPLPLGSVGESAGSDGPETRPHHQISTPVRAQHEEADGDDMKTMMKTMMGMIGGLSKDVQSVKSSVEAASQKADKAVSIAERTEAKMTEVQKTVVGKAEVQAMINDSVSSAVEMKIKNITEIKKTGPGPGASINTLVMGGLKGYSFQAAVHWIKKHVDPEDVYKMGPEGEEFKGMLFINLKDADEASRTLQVLRAILIDDNFGKPQKDRIWCDMKAPIEKRVCTGFLRGLRNQLIQWKFPQECASVAPEAGIL